MTDSSRPWPYTTPPAAVEAARVETLCSRWRAGAGSRCERARVTRGPHRQVRGSFARSRTRLRTLPGWRAPRLESTGTTNQWYAYTGTDARRDGSWGGSGCTPTLPIQAKPNGSFDCELGPARRDGGVFRFAAARTESSARFRTPRQSPSGDAYGHARALPLFVFRPRNTDVEGPARATETRMRCCAERERLAREERNCGSGFCIPCSCRRHG